MVGSRISLNVHGQNVPDTHYFLEHLTKLQPDAVLILDAAGLARDIKKTLPNTLVIHRSWGSKGDDNIHEQLSPKDWVAQKKKELDGADLWCYTTNEPQFSDVVLKWHVEVMELAAKEGLKLVVGNWAVGNPTDVDNDWKRAHRVLELLAEHRDTMILGLHEYACGVITSGFIGGTPEERGLIMPDTWPQDVSKIGAMWHCGRFNFAVKYCQSVGLRPPRIILTEHGFDDVSDIKSWTNKLAKTTTFGNQGGNIRGWKTLENQWNAWFSSLGWSFQRAYFEQLKYADQKIYQGSVVEAQLIFSWGHSSDIWAQFDIAEAKELHGLLEAYAREARVSAGAGGAASVEGISTVGGSTERIGPPVRGVGSVKPVDQNGAATKTDDTSTGGSEVVFNAGAMLAPENEAFSAQEIQTLITALRVAAGVAHLSEPAKAAEFERLIQVLQRRL
ncbi:MAG: hypothetical protein H6672_16145 [Anaerolineaceae bacterium]|nr:hypothetical protein [Anaerolineaceae bacterium]